MNIGILTIFEKKNENNSACLKSLTEAVEKKGHTVNVLDGTSREEIRLSHYEYVIVATHPRSFFSGNLPERVAECLAQGGSLIGKKSCGLIFKPGLMLNKACANLMAAMEKEGMVLDYSDIVPDTEYAGIVGKKF